jgi:Holliday junction resolvase RusA-like endonuclease
MSQQDRTLWVFRVEGDPVPRPEHKVGRGRHYAADHDHPIHAWRDRIALYGKPHRPPEPIVGPVSVRLMFMFRQPKSQRKRIAAPVRKFSARNDLDNLTKPVLDVLQRQGFFLDDGQVCKLTVEKWTVPDGMEPGVNVLVGGMASDDDYQPC